MSLPGFRCEKAARAWRSSLVWIVCAVFCSSAGLWGQSAAAEIDDGRGSCQRGDQALASQQWQEARDLYVECLAAAKPRFETLSNLGTAESRLGQMQDAIASYRRALALAPGNSKIEFNLALAYVKASDFNAAADQLLQLRKAAPDLRYEELLAFCYYHLGHYALAARAAEKVQAENPGDAANALILGSAYTRLGEYDKALPLITLALKTAGSADGHLIMGETLLGLRLYHPAMDELAQVAQLQPDLPGLHTALGIGKVGLGDSRGAESEFTLALSQNPEDYQANYYMGRLSRLDGDVPAAKKYLDKADRLQPGSAEVLFEQAAISVAARHYAQAIPMLNKVIAQLPNHREAHFLLAECDQKIGNLEAAKRERAIFEKLRDEQTAKDSSSSPSGQAQNDKTSVNEPPTGQP